MDPGIYELLKSYFEKGHVSKFFENIPADADLPSSEQGKELFIKHIDKFLNYEDGIMRTEHEKLVPSLRDFDVVLMLIVFSHLSPVCSRDSKNRLHPCHLSYVETLMIVQKVLWWPGMDEDVLKVVLDCPGCKTTVSPGLRTSQIEGDSLYQQAFKKDVLDPHPFSSSIRRASDVLVNTGPVFRTPLPRYRINQEATQARGATDYRYREKPTLYNHPVLKIVMEFAHPTTLPGVLMHEGATQVIDQMDTSGDVSSEHFVNIFLAVLASWEELEAEYLTMEQISVQRVTTTSSAPPTATVPAGTSTVNIATASTPASANNSAMDFSPSLQQLTLVLDSAGKSAMNSASSSAATWATVSATSSAAGHHARQNSRLKFAIPKSEDFEAWTQKTTAKVLAMKDAARSRQKGACGSAAGTAEGTKGAVAATKTAEKQGVEEVIKFTDDILSLLQKCRASNNSLKPIPQKDLFELHFFGNMLDSYQITPVNFALAGSGNVHQGLVSTKTDDFEGLCIDARELDEGKFHFTQQDTGRCYAYSFLRLLLQRNQGDRAFIDIPYTGIDTDIEFGLSLFDGIQKTGHATGTSEPICRNRHTAKPLEILTDDAQQLFDANIPPSAQHVTPGPGAFAQLFPKLGEALNKQRDEDSRDFMYFDLLLLTFARFIKAVPADKRAVPGGPSVHVKPIYLEPTYDMRIGRLDPTRNLQNSFEKGVNKFQAFIPGSPPSNDTNKESCALSLLGSINKFRHRHAMLMYITHFPLSSVAPTRQRPGYSCNLYRIGAPGPAGPIGVYVLYDESSTFIMDVMFEPQNHASTRDLFIILRRYNYDQSYRIRWRFLYVDESIEKSLFDQLRAKSSIVHSKLKVERKPAIKFPFLERFIKDYAMLGYHWQDYIWQLVATHNEAFLGTAYTPILPPAAVFDYGLTAKPSV